MIESTNINAPNADPPILTAPVAQTQAQQQQQSAAQTGAPVPRAKVWHRMQSGC